ncbi:hypothetical protein BDF14DRAFT_1973083 [Spinellus fusiger]|nr:hypothetical protein BDF14DRAFT_1973083 [Spinellus fusiger]
MTQSTTCPSLPTRKRTYLRPPQVATLQDSFDSNPLPDSTSRTLLARQIGVTDRTIQVWFQNRRAKSRKNVLGQTSFDQLRPSSLDPSRTLPRYQATFRTLMTPERFEELRQQQQDQQAQPRRRPRSASKPEPKAVTTVLLQRALSEGVSFDATPKLISLPVSVLRIGSWTRFSDSNAFNADWDLSCFGSPIEHQLIWQIQAQGHHFRVQIPYESISHLRLSQQAQAETGIFLGQLDVCLEPSQLEFSMWRLGIDTDWVRCGDFSQDRQATHLSLHTLQGNHDTFKLAMLDLVTLSPELASKVMIFTLPSLDSLKDMTLSPSSTPEPKNKAPDMDRMDFTITPKQSLPYFYPCEPMTPWSCLQQMSLLDTSLTSPWLNMA